MRHSPPHSAHKHGVNTMGYMQSYSIKHVQTPLTHGNPSDHPSLATRGEHPSSQALLHAAPRQQLCGLGRGAPAPAAPPAELCPSGKRLGQATALEFGCPGGGANDQSFFLQKQILEAYGQRGVVVQKLLKA